jgi:hypothetical protein
MSPLTAALLPPRICLFVHVHPMGSLNVQYSPEGATIPPQTPALFGNRRKLSETLQKLSLIEESNILMMSFSQADFTFNVSNSPELMDVFGFHSIGAIRR